ncbi:hypothetical protein BSL78_13764 [Apostichopus japonicus]|uniref:Uncharacterized protein n=1 Tax=Stichopus japonicus TaxID=307972 RepID=A0A2G8KMX4_STIJA|nr:hypothetical protein BSL78_13764 [Apostichopus japonicus]
MEDKKVENSEVPRIFFWSIPRTCSTVLMKLMSHVDDVQVWLEPYDCCYQTEYFLNSASKSQEMETWAQSVAESTKMVKECKSPYSGKMVQNRINVSYSWVKSELEKEEPGKKFIFIKDQTSGILEHVDDLPENVPCKHVFLIRHPLRALSGLRTYMLRRMTTEAKESFNLRLDPMYSAAWECHYKFWKYIKENKDPNALIIDTDDILCNPQPVLSKLFETLQIPWKDSYLKWPQGTEIVKEWKGVEDHFLRGMLNGVFDQAMQSVCLQPSKPLRSLEDMPEDIKEIAVQQLPSYEEMYALRL